MSQKKDTNARREFFTHKSYTNFNIGKHGIDVISECIILMNIVLYSSIIPVCGLAVPR